VNYFSAARERKKRYFLKKMSNRLAHKPSFREKKRYLQYEVVSNNVSRDQVETAINTSCLNFLGELTYSKAGIQFMIWNNNKGIIKVNRKYIKHLQACIALTDFSVRTTKVSGIIAKVKEA